jgi:hypothetical protein
MQRRGLQRGSVGPGATYCSAAECRRWWSWRGRSWVSLPVHAVVAEHHFDHPPGRFQSVTGPIWRAIHASAVSSAALTLDLGPRCMTATDPQPSTCPSPSAQDKMPFVGREIACGRRKAVARDAPRPACEPPFRDTNAQGERARACYGQMVGSRRNRFSRNVPLRPVRLQEGGDKIDRHVAISALLD